MEDNKIYVSEVEHDRLCRLDGAVGVLERYVKYNDSQYVDIHIITAILGIEKKEVEEECTTTNVNSAEQI